MFLITIAPMQLKVDNIDDLAKTIVWKIPLSAFLGVAEGLQILSGT